MNKSWIIIAFMLIAVAGLFHFGIVPFYIGGFTTLSLSEVQFKSTTTLPNGNFWNDKLWVLNLVQNGLGQRAYGSISPSEIGDSGETPENEFTIDVEWNKQQCKWDVKDDFTKPELGTYYIKTWIDYLGACWESDALSQCSNGELMYYNSKIQWGAYGSGNCFCIGYVDKGHFNKFGREWIRSSGQIYMTGAETASGNFDSEGSEGVAQGYIGDKIYMVYNGNLLLESCEPVGDDFVPVVINAQSKLVSMNDYSSYKAIYDTLNQNIGYSVDYLQLKQNVDSLTNIYDSFGYSSQGYFEGSTYIQDLDYSAVNPMWTLYIKSDFLGIEQPLPDFEIQASQNEQDKLYKRVGVEVSNSGQTGSGTLSLVKNLPFTPNPSVDVSVQKDSIKTYYLYYGVESNSPVCRTITIRLSSVSGVETDIIELCYEPSDICAPNHKECYSSNTKVEKCNSYGTGYIHFDNCGEDEKCEYDENDEAFCKKISGVDNCGDGGCTGDENCYTCSKDCGCKEGEKCENMRCVPDSGLPDLNTILIATIVILMVLTVGIIGLKLSRGKPIKKLK